MMMMRRRRKKSRRRRARRRRDGLFNENARMMGSGKDGG